MKPFQPISVKDKLPHILIIPALWVFQFFMEPFILLHNSSHSSFFIVIISNLFYDLQKYKIWLTYQRHLDRKIRYTERQPG